MSTDVVVKVLAVVGGGIGGGLALGLLAQLLMRAATIRNPPRWSMVTIRLTGCVICGWLVALWLFGGGGPGIGGSGGWGFGSGKDNGARLEDAAKKDGDGRGQDGARQTSSDETLRIEVLGNAVLSESDRRAERWYRLETAKDLILLTFAEVKEAVEKRQQEQPPLRRIEIVLYKDSPDEHVPLVSRLRIWAGDRNNGKMRVDIVKRDADAPRK